MERSQRGKSEYKVRYSFDRNAALQPEFVPQPQRSKKTKAAKKPSAKAMHRAEVKKYTAIAVIVVMIAAVAFCIVSRNALIYSNTKEIRRLAKEKANLELQVNSAEKMYSENSELSNYFEVAETKLALVYPENDEIIEVVCPPLQPEAVKEEKAVNVYDAVLDWVNALFRGDNSWA